MHVGFPWEYSDLLSGVAPDGQPAHTVWRWSLANSTAATQRDSQRHRACYAAVRSHATLLPRSPSPAQPFSHAALLLPTPTLHAAAHSPHRTHPNFHTPLPRRLMTAGRWRRRARSGRTTSGRGWRRGRRLWRPRRWRPSRRRTFTPRRRWRRWGVKQILLNKFFASYIGVWRSRPWGPSRRRTLTPRRRWRGWV